MLHYDRINVSEGIDIAKSKNGKERIICYYRLFNHGFEFQDSICNGCYYLLMLRLNIGDIANFTVIGADYCYIINEISKFEAIHLSNFEFEDRGYI